jgi:hypothetical protein
MTFDPWGPLQGLLIESNDSELARSVVSSAGLPPTRDLTAEENYSHKTRVHAIVAITSGSYSKLDEKERQVFATNVARELLAKKAQYTSALNDVTVLAALLVLP